MDTSSGNTILNNNSKQNFISQELYNEEVLQRTPEITTSTDQRETNQNNFDLCAKDSTSFIFFKDWL